MSDQLKEVRSVLQEVITAPWLFSTEEKAAINMVGRLLEYRDALDVAMQSTGIPLDDTMSPADAINSLVEYHRKRARSSLLAVVIGFLDSIDPPPDADCSCHIHPPCSDCVEYGFLREVISRAELEIKNHG